MKIANWSIFIIVLAVMTSFSGAERSAFEKLEAGDLYYGPTIEKHYSDTVQVEYGTQNFKENEKVWKRYCDAKNGAASTDLPRVNYRNSDVKEVAHILSKKVSPMSYYFYSGIAKAYGVKTWVDGKYDYPTPAENTGAPEGTTGEAHAFLVMLCGEFRDRATMIESKINWVRRFYKLPIGKQERITNKQLNALVIAEEEAARLAKKHDKNPSTKLASEIGELTKQASIWSLVKAADYQGYLDFSRELFDARHDEMRHIGEVDGFWENYFPAGPKGYDQEEIESPVKGQLVCEAKYIFSKFVTAGLAFEDLDDSKDKRLETYRKGYEKFAETGYGENDNRPKLCSWADKNHFYTFRGDSNFKPNSPESNGMIWSANSVANHCQTTTSEKSKSVDAGDIAEGSCANYFKSPFYNRWNSARAALGSWLFHDEEHAGVFGNELDPFWVESHSDQRKRPYEFGYKEGSSKEKSGLADFLDPEFFNNWNLDTYWSQRDKGFNLAAGNLGLDSDFDPWFVYLRLRNAVDRHTDWYASGYRDGRGMKKEAAYSPFVASSYEMSESDGFTYPGKTINAPSDGRKHWMFIFRVKASNWFNTDTMGYYYDSLVKYREYKASGEINMETEAELKANVNSYKGIDFDLNWFDETSFGTSDLAKTERAWDRLGTALEPELDSVVYLHNIKIEGDIEADKFEQ